MKTLFTWFFNYTILITHTHTHNWIGLLVLTTSSPALSSTWGSLMKCESRLSALVVFLWSDNFELLSRDVDKEDTLGPLETEGDRDDGDETFETVLLNVLLPVLSNDICDVDKLVDEFSVDLFVATLLPTSELFSDLGVRLTCELEIEFLVSDTFGLVEGLAAIEGSELLLTSGSDRFNGSEEVADVGLPPTTELTLSCRLLTETGCFSGKPPVLFLLVTGIELKPPEVPVTFALVIIGFATLDRNSEPLFSSVLFLAAPIDPVTVGLASFAVLFAFSVKFGIFCFEFELTSTDPSPAIN